MIKGEKWWRSRVERDLRMLGEKRASKGQTGASYLELDHRLRDHYREGVRIGIVADDDLLCKCLPEGRGGFKI